MATGQRSAFEIDSLDTETSLNPEKAGRMTRALETESFDTKDIVAASGWIESAHITD